MSWHEREWETWERLFPHCRVPGRNYKEVSFSACIFQLLKVGIQKGGGAEYTFFVISLECFNQAWSWKQHRLMLPCALLPAWAWAAASASHRAPLVMRGVPITLRHRREMPQIWVTRNGHISWVPRTNGLFPLILLTSWSTQALTYCCGIYLWSHCVHFPFSVFERITW